MRDKYRNTCGVTFYIILPTLLFLFGIFTIISYLKTSEFGILNLDVLGNFNQLSPANETTLFKGDKVNGKFHSKYSNLGLVLVRFTSLSLGSDDILVFRIREADNDKKLYEAKYKTDQFQSHKLFPFGFPIITNSANKDYVFEIESLQGTGGNSVSIDYTKPVFIAKSSFSRSELLMDNKKLVSFLLNKLTNIFNESETRVNILLSFLPFICYLIYLISPKNNYLFLIGVIILFTFWDIFYLAVNYDLLYLSTFLLWIMLSIKYRFESRIACLFAISFLALTSIMLIIKYDKLAEKAAVWSFLFLCITVLQQVYELIKKPKKLLSYNDFLTQLFRNQGK